jgi:hypothetical protein
MAVTWSGDELEDYLDTLGIDPARSSVIQDYVYRVTTALTYISRDSTMADVFAGLLRPIIDVADGAYGAIAEADVLTWIRANRPNIQSAMAVLLSKIVFTDVLAIADSPVERPYLMTAKQMYLAQIANNFTRIVYYLRHFTGMDHPERPGESKFVWSG